MARNKPEQDEIASQAAHWLVLLSVDDEHERAGTHAAFEAWKRADPRHAEAAVAMEGLLGQVGALRANGGAALGARTVSSVLTSRGRRRRTRAGLAILLLAGVALLPGWLVLRTYSPAYLLADIRSGVGQWTSETLPDGTRLMLNAASAVNLRYDAGQRVVELIQGDMLVDVAKDATRPFIVETRDGSMRALGTRFQVSRQSDATQLGVLESQVEARSGTVTMPVDQATRRVDAGWQVRITAQGVGPLVALDVPAIEDAWQRRRLLVDDQPLTEVLDILSRYRRGVLRYDARALAGIRISAVLPLDDTDRALQLLEVSLPGLRVRMFTSYWVQVDSVPRP